MKLQTFFFTAIIISHLGLSSCGYQLRGYSAEQAPSLNNVIHQRLSNKPILLRIKGGKDADNLHKSLVKELARLNVVTNTQANDDQATQLATDTHNYLKIDNVRLQKYELVGVLTEVRVVLSADVIYYVGDGQEVTQHHYNLLVEDSYQHNKASVSFADNQGKQVAQALYQKLSQRIAEQYITLQ